MTAFRIAKLSAGISAIALLLNGAPALSQDGGFIDSSANASVQAKLRASDVRSFLPSKGAFNFPAPWNSEGVRLTNADDCNGGDCVYPVGYSYWNNSNYHVGSDTMLIMIGMKNGGPTLIEYNKKTDAVSNLGPIFDSSSNYSNFSGEGWYFSRSQPTKLYLNNVNSSSILRYDLATEKMEKIVDVNDELGGNNIIWQQHSSSDDRVHSATIKSASSYNNLGCMAYEEDSGKFHWFPSQGDFDECQVDKSGNWLVIKENVDGRDGEDNRIIDLRSGKERVLTDREGAGGHSDLGHGYMIAADNFDGTANTQKLWDFTASSLKGVPVYSNGDWNVQAPAHLSHTNARPGSADQQYACGSSANSGNGPHGNEVICFRLDGSKDVLVVAPIMTDMNASGGGDSYNKSPKGNLDVTGQYFIWTSNMGGDRMDAFLVKVPSQLLGASSAPAPAPAPKPQPKPEAQPAPSAPAPAPAKPAPAPAPVPVPAPVPAPSPDVAAPAPNPIVLHVLGGTSVVGGDTTSASMAAGAVSLDLAVAKSRFSADERVRVSAEIRPEAGHENQPADVYITARMTKESGESVWLYKNAQGQFTVWDAELESLEPAQELANLSKRQPINVYEGELPAGKWELYLGYLVEGKGLIYSGEPMEISAE